MIGNDVGVLVVVGDIGVEVCYCGVCGVGEIVYVIVW